MKPFNKLRVVILLLLLTALPSAGKTSIRLSLGEWKPYISESMPDYGTFTQIVTESFALSGISVEYSFYPWKRAVYLAREGLVDGVIAIAHSKEREDEFLFSKDPILIGERVFFHMKDYPFHWNDMEDLKDIPIGGTFEYFYGEEFAQAEAAGKIQVDRVNSDLQNLQKLLAGRIKVFPITREIGQYIIKTDLSENKGKFTFNEKPLITTAFYIVLPKKSKSSEELISLFNSGFTKLKQSGRYQELLINMKNSLNSDN
ncbi:substrate-binding periplasmic protein [Vibrio sp. HN007]|uniref:substrate-binding periplasmic protein n=1 Tax=Vibrio iocasae TaxID=3098914 RepID=UPI0035D4F40D